MGWFFMNLSLCCISNVLSNEGTRFRRITYKSFSSISKNEAINKIGLIALHNLEVCLKTIKQCVSIGISGYRISSDLFPLLNHPDICMKIDDLPNVKDINFCGAHLEIGERYTERSGTFKQHQQIIDIYNNNANKRILELNKINNYITGIQFANTVSYDKQDNTPDLYLKNIARVLGWDLISSVIENDLITISVIGDIDFDEVEQLIKTTFTF